ncbi:type II 3-dehydroquinate dehydratase [Maritalea mediterranea]|uniref:3-dehydroquinate dehydratase n=1 Tax=Maritalea mediterranea TaxID=2909667 RepID=A0ABS9EAE3_9HYPH|nr:type II 3-dehydroquinate dehydratase [Maritalea mediterranea]MCF4099845.1 type II 3-dehydroquinate dehydratase [Maritalea mediterranea]
MTKKIHILNGPNLNLLGTREGSIYGYVTLADIEKNCREECARLGVELEFAQSNHEGELVDLIQRAGESADGIIINPAAYTHTSVAIHDAIRAVNLPVVEVHLSNIYAREDFRHHSYVSPVALGTICGFGPAGYILALGALTSHLPE